jgi:hypothetical protein
MRLQLIIGLLAAIAPAVARAQSSAERAGDASFRVYADDDHVTVISPSASTRAPIGRTLAIDLAANVDIVTAASVDVTSQASITTVHERRYETDVALAWAVNRRLTVTPRLVGSIENDYRSLHAGAAVALDSAHHERTLELAYTAAIDEVGRAGDPSFARAHDGHRLSLTLTQVVDPRTFVDLVADGAIESGYLASPYRYVPIVDPAGVKLYALDEQTPGVRASLAALARVRRAIGRWFVHADYRLYADTWSIVSHTVSARALLPLARGRVTLAALVRGYLQSGASFYRATYVDNGMGAPAWRTRDRVLSPMRSVSASLVADVALGRGSPADGMHLQAAIDLMRFEYLDFVLQHRRDAVVLSLGVTVPF